LPLLPPSLRQAVHLQDPSDRVLARRQLEVRLQPLRPIARYGLPRRDDLPLLRPGGLVRDPLRRPAPLHQSSGTPRFVSPQPQPHRVATRPKRPGRLPNPLLLRPAHHLQAPLEPRPFHFAPHHATVSRWAHEASAVTWFDSCPRTPSSELGRGLMSLHYFPLTSSAFGGSSLRSGLPPPETTSSTSSSTSPLPPFPNTPAPPLGQYVPGSFREPE